MWLLACNGNIFQIRVSHFIVVLEALKASCAHAMGRSFYSSFALFIFDWDSLEYFDVALIFLLIV
jgi:hypothetical protein